MKLKLCFKTKTATWEPNKLRRSITRCQQLHSLPSVLCISPKSGEYNSQKLFLTCYLCGRFLINFGTHVQLSELHNVLNHILPAARFFLIINKIKRTPSAGVDDFSSFENLRMLDAYCEGQSLDACCPCCLWMSGVHGAFCGDLTHLQSSLSRPRQRSYDINRLRQRSYCRTQSTLQNFSMTAILRLYDLFRPKQNSQPPTRVRFPQMHVLK